MILFGIKNCDTVKKARAWLEGRGIEYTFHDFKLLGLSQENLDTWIASVGWQKLLNRAGTTFRKLPDEAKTDLDSSHASALMLAQPSMVKRPVLSGPHGLTVGFDPERYAEVFSS